MSQTTPATNTPTLAKCQFCKTKFEPNSFPEWNEVFCSEQCSRYFKRKGDPGGYLKSCNVPARYQTCNFKNFDLSPGTRDAHTALLRLKTLDGNPIYLTGGVGAGKTHLSVALIRNMRTLYPGKASFQAVTHILMELRSSFSKENYSEKEALQFYLKDEILIMDDMGSEKLTDYVIQAWYSIIDYRYSNMLPTVITSNLSVAMLASRFGDRIASRVASGMVLTLKGSDRRLRKWNK